MRKLLVLALLAFSASLAKADSLPVYDLGMGTVTLTNLSLGGFNIVFSFSNGQGVSIGGVAEGFSPLSLVGGGEPGNPLLNIFGSNLTTANVNGTTLFLFGTVTITGSNFTLPTSGTSFSITEPVLFSGTFLSCQGGFGPINGGCNPPGNNFLGQFNVNGRGTVSLNFLGVPMQDGSVVWELKGGTYTLSAVPEPATILLLGTGALAIFGRLRKFL